MNFYKIITITNDGKRRISFCAKPGYKIGWSHNEILDRKRLVLEASAIEFQAYIRGRVSSAPPIRSVSEILVDENNEAYSIKTYYIPNRSQRKHGIKNTVPDKD